MQPSIAQERPPYVRFEYRPVEDRAESLKQGRYVSKDRAFAIITPQGSKDMIERPVDEWFQHLAEQVAQERFNPAWLAAFRDNFKYWEQGMEPPVDGTDVRNWPVASPSQVKQLLEFRIRTVEDLAVANEETIMRLGMGGRAMKEKAIEWLASAKNVGQVAEESHALKVENVSLKAKVGDLETRLAAAEARLAVLAPEPKAGPVIETL